MQIVRRVGRMTVALLAALAVAAAAAVAARDAVYWEKPLPGVTLAQVDLTRPIEVVVDDKTYAVQPSEALRVDDTATQAALVQAGHDSFLRRVRQLADPSPPALEVSPVLVPRPGADRVAKRLSQSLPKPRRAQVVSRNGSFSILPSQPGDAVDAEGLVAALEKAALTNARTLSPALTHVEPTLTTPAAETAVTEARALVDQPVALTFKGEDVGSLAPGQLAKLVRFWVGVESFRVAFDPQRVAKAVEPLLAQWRQRAVNARFVLDGERVLIRPSRPGLAVDGRWAADSVAAAADSSFSRASLRLKQIRADLTTREAEKLGIRQRISTFTTDMGPSSSTGSTTSS